MRRGSILKRLFWLLIAAVVGFYLLIAISLVALRVVNPFTTAVQVQRRVEAAFAKKAYQKRNVWVPMDRIAPVLQHAVVAAEDARFYQHHGFDWTEVQIAVHEAEEGVRTRGASTITQQLVKNLYLTTSRSYIRKGVEFTLVPLAEQALGKKRILELYLNEIEWGPGIYGAEAAAQQYFHVPAAKLTREQALELAAIIPAPLRRRIGRQAEYIQIIDERMRQMGW